MTTSTKAVNWSVETTDQLVAAYAENQDVKALAKQFGRTEAAVRGKLVSLSVYQKKATATATGGAVRKVALVEALAKKLNVSTTVLESLEKANKETLELLLKALPEVTVTETETE